MRSVLACVACLLFLAAPASAGDLCLVASPNGFNATVDCDPLNPLIHENAVVGYSEEGTPCLVSECFIFEPGRGGSRDYGWQISASDTDPNVNVGELPVGIVSLYLWLNCTTFDGMTAAEMSVVATDGNLFVLGFIPMSGVLNAGSPTDLQLAVGGCPWASFPAGEFLLFNTGPVSVETETWGGIKAMYR